MKNNMTIKGTWIALMISSILSMYYIVIQDFLEVNTVVGVIWAIFNLALVYRLVVLISYSKKKLKKNKTI